MEIQLADGINIAVVLGVGFWLHRELASLRERMAKLEGTVSGLQTGMAGMQSNIAGLQSNVNSLLQYMLTADRQSNQGG